LVGALLLPVLVNLATNSISVVDPWWFLTMWIAALLTAIFVVRRPTATAEQRNPIGHRGSFDQSVQRLADAVLGQWQAEEERRRTSRILIPFRCDGSPTTGYRTSMRTFGERRPTPAQVASIYVEVLFR